MSNKYEKDVTVKRDGLIVTETTEDFTVDGESVFDGTVPSPSGGKVLNVAFATAKLQLLEILSDQDIVLTPQWSGGALSAINLTAGIAYRWDINNGFAVPFAHDVTSIVATTNGSGKTANVQVYAAFDN